MQGAREGDARKSERGERYRANSREGGFGRPASRAVAATTTRSRFTFTAMLSNNPLERPFGAGQRKG